MLDSTSSSFQARQDILRAWSERLYSEYENILYQFNLRLAKPVIRIEPLSRDWGSWAPETRTITLALRLIEEHRWDVVLEVLKHEMAHQISDERLNGKYHAPHGELFKRACRMLGVADWAAGAAGALPREIPDWRRQTPEPEEERLLKRAEKLLALAESSNEHEAALAIERVRALYAKYNLGRLAAGSRATYVHCIISRRRRRIESEESAIFGILTAHFMVRAIFTTVYDAMDLCEYRAVELLGTRENVLMAEYVYHFLLHQLDVLWERYRGRSGVAPGSRRSYMLGVLEGFRAKLDQQATVSSVEGLAPHHNPQALLRLADRQLDGFVQRRHPKLATRRWGSGYGDADSFGAGVADGGSIHLHRGIDRHGGNRGLRLTDG